MKPNEQLREVETVLRSTLYISSTGNMYRNYHDTGKWDYVHPRCDSHGKMCGYKNKTIQRLIAEAWLEPPGATTKKNRLPTVRTIDPQKNPYNVENIEWCYGRRCTSDKIDIKLPPKLELLQELLMEEEFHSVTEISDCLDVSVPTTWNYICKLVSQNPSMELVQKAIILVNGSCLKICLQEELKGTLKESIMHINRMLENDEEWNKETEKYSHLRLSRMYRDILNSN